MCHPLPEGLGFPFMIVYGFLCFFIRAFGVYLFDALLKVLAQLRVSICAFFCEPDALKCIPSRATSSLWFTRVSRVDESNIDCFAHFPHHSFHGDGFAVHLAGDD